MKTNYRKYLSELDESFLEQCGLTRNSTVDEIISKLQWSTYGPNADTKKFKWIKLRDCTSVHLRKIRALPDVYKIHMIAIDIILSIRQLKTRSNALVGTNWCRNEPYDPAKGPYNTYTVLFVTNTDNIHKKHACQVVYYGDNGRHWSLPLSKWPGNLVQIDYKTANKLKNKSK